jgi:hypothetical protein
MSLASHDTKQRASAAHVPEISSGIVTLAARGLALVWLRHAPWAGPAFLLSVFAAIAVFSLLRPVANWDMVPYLSIALSKTGAPFDEVHRLAYAILKGALEPGAYAAITEGDAYRLRQYGDPAALQSMLGMYDVKWLYVRLLAAIGPETGWLAAFKAINLTALGLLFLSLWAWMSRHRLQAFAPLIAGAALMLGLADTYRVATPDFLALALMTSGVLLLDRGRLVGAVAALTLAVLARPDGAVALCLIGAAFIIFTTDKRGPGLLLIAAGIAAYAFASAMSSSPGWWPHLWFSTYQMQDTMVGFAPDFSLRVYAIAFAYNAGRALTENVWAGAWLVSVFMFIWLVADSRASERMRDPRMLMMAALAAGIAAKFVLFPLHDTRTYLPMLFPLLVLTGGQVALLANGRKPCSAR